MWCDGTRERLSMGSKIVYHGNVKHFTTFLCDLKKKKKKKVSGWLGLSITLNAVNFN